jgi:hypothetical protein
MCEFIAVNETRTQVNTTNDVVLHRQTKDNMIDVLGKMYMYMKFNGYPKLNCNHYILSKILKIKPIITIITITSIVLTGEQIQQDSYLIVIDCTMYIKVASINW